MKIKARECFCTGTVFVSLCYGLYWSCFYQVPDWIGLNYEKGPRVLTGLPIKGTSPLLMEIFASLVFIAACAVVVLVAWAISSSICKGLRRMARWATN